VFFLFLGVNFTTILQAAFCKKNCAAFLCFQFVSFGQKESVEKADFKMLVKCCIREHLQVVSFANILLPKNCKHKM